MRNAYHIIIKGNILKTKNNEFSVTKQDEKNTNPILHINKFNIGMMIHEKYEIKREISRGGMGIVYEAYDHSSNRQVAIKIILANKIDTIQLKRFQKEIEASSCLSHPNVIKIYDAGTYNNNPYIVMEYIDGVNIAQYVEQQNDTETGKERDWKLCAKLIYETALGLEYIHKQNMFHRDIKPTNIIVRSDGSPVIIDLGLVKFNKERSYNLTRSRDIIGTCQYMPIEQVQGKRGEIDARSDVYSLGLVLYELLTGQKAYSGKNMTDVFNKIASYYPPLPREINPRIPEILEEITIHATEKQKERRYSTAQEFADALQQYLTNTNAKATKKYANYKKRLLLQRNKNKMIVACIVLFVTIPFIIMTIARYNREQEKPQYNKIDKKQDSLNIKNNIESQYKLGLMYEQGIKVKQDLKKACEWYEKAANQGDINAQCKLADIYYKGQGIKRDFAKAFEWYEKLAKQGNTEAQYRLGWMYQRGEGVQQSYPKAFFWYEKAIEKNYAPAQRELGYLYYNYQGIYKGIKQDWEKAIYFFEKAGNQGDPAAQFGLGVMYLNGERVKKNYSKSIEWFGKAACQKNETDPYLLGYVSNSQFHLGHVYKYKVSSKENLQKAFFLFEKVANQGDARGQNEIASMYLNGSVVKQDYEKAVYWYEKSAKQGNQYSQTAQYYLGILYSKGKGVKQDYEKAVYWYEKSAKQGNEYAQYNLACLYNNGDGVKQDLQKAKEWYEKAANQGNAEAQLNLGALYYYGQGIEQDYKKAFILFEQSANKGYKIAQFDLATMYYEGKGVKRDIEKAKYWYEKAAKQGYANAKIKLNEILKNQ